MRETGMAAAAAGNHRVQVAVAAHTQRGTRAEEVWGDSRQAETTGIGGRVLLMLPAGEAG